MVPHYNRHSHPTQPAAKWNTAPSAAMSSRAPRLGLITAVTPVLMASNFSKVNRSTSSRLSPRNRPDEVQCSLYRIKK